ncbi:hypothetical protein RFI_13620 [Reticulomyxa filosa]|uniref:Uncharacterized protein n=1 Tax=Reticulomyxa filosa TaxID=46433 RepID=X6NC14_RETFI|nr:hypothetical protein RFI_13620 [Reticulomyxa filosa]|eukprot:ETO23561.1 hypothetical protein RFI_13620 [Reticulomyxa filosa]
MLFFQLCKWGVRGTYFGASTPIFECLLHSCVYQFDFLKDARFQLGESIAARGIAGFLSGMVIFVALTSKYNVTWTHILKYSSCWSVAAMTATALSDNWYELASRNCVFLAMYFPKINEGYYRRIQAHTDFHSLYIAEQIQRQQQLLRTLARYPSHWDTLADEEKTLLKSDLFASVASPKDKHKLELYSLLSKDQRSIVAARKRAKSQNFNLDGFFGSLLGREPVWVKLPSHLFAPKTKTDYA